jgi:hypothetical protein
VSYKLQQLPTRIHGNQRPNESVQFRPSQRQAQAQNSSADCSPQCADQKQTGVSVKHVGKRRRCGVSDDDAVAHLSAKGPANGAQRGDGRAPPNPIRASGNQTQRQSEQRAGHHRARFVAIIAAQPPAN